jgi:hypothetical protein
MKSARLVILMVVVTVLMTACYASRRAKDVKFSGFLSQGEYRLLTKATKTEKDQALYTYVKPNLNLVLYKKVLLDPVQVMRPADQTGVVSEDVQKVVNNFYIQLTRELSKDYDMAKEPGPDTLRVQVALTRVDPGSGTMQVITSVVPFGIGADVAQDFVTGKPSFAGDISVEARVTDARSGELLAAGVDRRIAEKNIVAAMDTWNGVTKVTEIWSKIFAYRLCKTRGAENCVAPSS